MPQDMFSYPFAQQRTRFLIESIVHTTIDPPIVDVVGDLLEGRVAKHDAGRGFIRQRDGVSVNAEHALENRARGPTEARMARRKWETAA